MTYAVSSQNWYRCGFDEGKMSCWIFYQDKIDSLSGCISWQKTENHAKQTDAALIWAVCETDMFLTILLEKWSRNNYPLRLKINSSVFQFSVVIMRDLENIFHVHMKNQNKQTQDAMRLDKFSIKKMFLFAHLAQEICCLASQLVHCLLYHKLQEQLMKLW